MKKSIGERVKQVAQNRTAKVAMIGAAAAGGLVGGLAANQAPASAATTSTLPAAEAAQQDDHGPGLDLAKGYTFFNLGLPNMGADRGLIPGEERFKQALKDDGINPNYASVRWDAIADSQDDFQARHFKSNAGEVELMLALPGFTEKEGKLFGPDHGEVVLVHADVDHDKGGEVTDIKNYRIEGPTRGEDTHNQPGEKDHRWQGLNSEEDIEKAINYDIGGQPIDAVKDHPGAVAPASEAFMKQQGQGWNEDAAQGSWAHVNPDWPKPVQ